MKIEQGIIHWFIHEESKTPLGFIRMKDGGALMIGGETGSHCTCHGEAYWKKLKYLVALGYTPVEIAQELKMIPGNWSPPKISPSDQELVDRIRRKEI